MAFSITHAPTLASLVQASQPAQPDTDGTHDACPSDDHFACHMDELEHIFDRDWTCLHGISAAPAAPDISNFEEACAVHDNFCAPDFSLFWDCITDVDRMLDELAFNVAEKLPIIENQHTMKPTVLSLHDLLPHESKVPPDNGKTSLRVPNESDEYNVQAEESKVHPDTGMTSPCAPSVSDEPKVQAPTPKCIEQLFSEADVLKLFEAEHAIFQKQLTALTLQYVEQIEQLNLAIKEKTSQFETIRFEFQNEISKLTSRFASFTEMSDC